MSRRVYAFLDSYSESESCYYHWAGNYLCRVSTLFKRSVRWSSVLDISKSGAQHRSLRAHFIGCQSVRTHHTKSYSQCKIPIPRHNINTVSVILLQRFLVKCVRKSKQVAMNAKPNGKLWLCGHWTGIVIKLELKTKRRVRQQQPPRRKSMCLEWNKVIRLCKAVSVVYGFYWIQNNISLSRVYFVFIRSKVWQKCHTLSKSCGSFWPREISPSFWKCTK